MEVIVSTVELAIVYGRPLQEQNIPQFPILRDQGIRPLDLAENRFSFRQANYVRMVLTRPPKIFLD